jgi:uncharacterized MAPEG superfamily protein
MSTDLEMLLASALLAWFMLLTASLLRTHAYRLQGWAIAFGNRHDVPEATPLVGRADRASRNMVENLVIFTAVLGAARLSGVHDAKVDLGAKIFFWSRMVYFPVYLAGIPYLRTAIWCISLVGLAVIAGAALSLS